MKLELLEQLQGIDLQMDALKEAQNILQKDIAEIENALLSAQEALTDQNARASQLETERTDLEGTLATELENIKRSESHMKEIKTNKEFQAIGREIATARKQANELEEKLLQKIGQIDEAKAAAASLAENLEELNSNSSERLGEKQQEIDNIQKDVDADATRRSAITSELPPRLLQRYDTLRGQRRGLAVVNAQDGYCLGCNMHIPPQMYNTLYKGDELINCPHCQRVLILKQPVATS